MSKIYLHNFLCLELTQCRHITSRGDQKCLIQTNDNTNQNIHVRIEKSSILAIHLYSTSSHTM